MFAHFNKSTSINCSESKHCLQGVELNTSPYIKYMKQCYINQTSIVYFFIVSIYHLVLMEHFLIWDLLFTTDSIIIVSVADINITLGLLRQIHLPPISQLRLYHVFISYLLLIAHFDVIDFS